MRAPLMKQFHLMMFLLLCLTKVLSSTSLLTAKPSITFPVTKPGCNSTCVGGATKIPYPFGIGSDCALSEWYTVTCYGSEARIRIKGDALDEEFVLQEVSLGNKTITISFAAPVYEGRTANKSSSSLNLNGTPFYFSKDQNKLRLIGCGNAILDQNFLVGSQVLSACTSNCKDNSITDIRGCFGVKCCETDIPFHLKQYRINFTVPEEYSDNQISSCTAALLVDPSWIMYNYSEFLFPDGCHETLTGPLVLSWTITDAIFGCKSIVQFEYSDEVTDFGCECETLGSQTWFYDINPYLNGSCDYAYSVMNRKIKNTEAAIIGASVGSGVLFLVIAICTSYKLINKWRNKKIKRQFFERNGGLLLQQQLSAHAGVSEKTNVFTIEELDKASDGFNANRILGEGGQGTVYKGMLTDGNIIAIKKSKKIDENQLHQLQQFVNELFILSQINHRNVVKLLGCCLETEVPLLVYEFIPNGTLYNLLHNGHSEEFPLTWNIRLRIAREIANAVAYLHSAASTPIFHKDIKSNNILLGEKYIAKVSDFGTSRSVAIDQTHLTTRVQGTSGYCDPEYFQSGQFTEKSDVYSYGVVLVELLTRQKPASARAGESYLAARFLKSMRQGSLKTILDPVIVDGRFEEEVTAVAKLAHRCLNSRREGRPTMTEVVWELESVNLSTLGSTTQANSPGPSPLAEEYSESVQLCGTVDTWTFGNSAGVSSASDDASHLLFHAG